MDYSRVEGVGKAFSLRRRPIALPVSQAQSSVRGAWPLWLYGMGMLIPMVYFALRYPLRGNSELLFDIGQLSQYKRGEYLAYVVGLAILYVLYVLALRESRRLATRQGLPAVFGCGTALAVAMAWMYPATAVDVFTYAVRSRLLTTYNANPLAALFKNYPRDPWMRFAHSQWAAVPSPYGPLWNLIAAPITRFAGDRMTVALVGFKLLALGCLLAGGWVIGRTLASSSTPSPTTGALFYLWNPLVLWEGIGNAHNDVVMTLPLLLALLAWRKRQDYLVIPLLVVAALIKYVPALLIPLAAIVLWRRAASWSARWSLIGWSVGLSVLVADIALYPFYDLRAVLNSVAAQGRILRMSPAAVVFHQLVGRYPQATIGQWLRLGTRGILLATMVGLTVVLWKRPQWLPRACFEVLFVFLLVATWYFNPWYLIWPVGLAALLPWGWPSWRIITWTAGAMATYALMIWIAAWWRLDLVRVQNIGVPLMLTATLLLTCAEPVYALRRGRQLITEGVDVTK